MSVWTPHRVEDAAVEQPGRREGVEGDRPAGRVGQFDDAVDHGDGDLGDQQDGQHAAVDVHPQHAEDGDDGPRGEGTYPPVDADAEAVLQQSAQDRSEAAVEADLHGVVAEQCDERGPDAGDAAEALGGVAVERASVDDLPAHRGVADRELREGYGDGQVGERDADDAGDRPAGGRAAGHDGQWGGGRQHEGHDGGDAEPVAGEGLGDDVEPAGRWHVAMLTLVGR